ncbi:MAG TPA: DegT/DnrJ/EryC1/StrS family aminotransferase [Phycisphaerae bacterium]|nr:DegT/DnrJ/EryC1/StrS family aminotransferase [Phycisphaerae bacterium]HRY70316.1 DegT/DnrJ/EryC1/StrS family aminotransferase [Phycisphaerae bacterium]HSA28033.1 DegT/DnrJ/EryC1/StrS family aminotransferase [Phycisphaerae bacterium]
MAEKLAIAGGTPVLTRGDFKNWPVITDDDRRYINEVLDSGIVAGATAPQVVALQTEWAKFVGARYCLTTASGTAALHMALAAVGVGPGDEVIVPAYTFLASASCIMHQMAIPVFVDIEPNTCTIDPAKIEAVITERTKAIIPVHIQGCPAAMDPILETAGKHDLRVIEDACQAHGALYRGRRCGTMGIAGAFSLNNLKNLCGGEGGLFVTDDEDILKKGDLVRYFGDECDEATLRQKYNSSILGYMYRNQELPAALARGQLRHLEEHNDTRIRNAEYLNRELGNIPGVVPPRCPPDCRHVYWLYALRFDPHAAGIEAPPRRFRMAIEKSLFKEGVLVGQWQTMPVPGQDIFQSMIGIGNRYPWAINEAKGITYRYDPNAYPVAQMFCDSYTIVHSIHPPNGRELNRKVVLAFQKVFDHLGEVMDHADDDIRPGFDGRLYGVG